MDNGKCVLLFPPNWSACISGPHLALPLLAGGAKASGWDVETWDLSEEFYRRFCRLPETSAIIIASQKANFGTLDKLYFDWEDQLRSHCSGNENSTGLGLLSGYSFSQFQKLPLTEVQQLVPKGTVYTSFFLNYVLPRLATAKPSVVAITIASQNQMIPAIELLQLIRKEFPEIFLVLGGNVVTRLRESSAFRVLFSLADQTVLFQGDEIFINTLQAISELGVMKARQNVLKITAQEKVAYSSWACPSFDGIDFTNRVGIPVLPYVSTRGCYWGKCKFCAIPAGWSTTGYAGSAPVDLIIPHLKQMIEKTGITRIKFVDEAFHPDKMLLLASCIHDSQISVEWEAYARLEKAWENIDFLKKVRAGGLRKVYFGLEQSPNTKRSLLAKNDSGDPIRILHLCNNANIKVHLFCMVGYPGTSRADAMATTEFLLDNSSLVDTADLVGFRLERGVTVPGTHATKRDASDWHMSLHYEPIFPDVLSLEAILDVEKECQEILWASNPHFLHPLYRIVGSWDNLKISRKINHTLKQHVYV